MALKHCPECGHVYRDREKCPECGDDLIPIVRQIVTLLIMVLVGAVIVGAMIVINVTKAP